MSPEDSGQLQACSARFEQLRPRLFAIAYGLLGSVGEAEDVVQEAWIRLQRAEVERIDDLSAWLVTTTSRIGLDVLRSARSRRETYVGPWLPEPLETSSHSDPADAMSLVDSLSWAVLVVLETLTPAERAAFVLHDVFELSFPEIAAALGRSPAACRKLASRAREHVRQRKPRFDVDPAAHRELIQAFAEASTSGNLEALVRLLDPAAVFTADGGGVVPAAGEPIVGAEPIAQFLAWIARHHPRACQATVVNGCPALLYLEGERLAGIMALGLAGGRITTIDFIRNPNKFHGLRSRAWAAAKIEETQCKPESISSPPPSATSSAKP